MMILIGVAWVAVAGWLVVGVWTAFSLARQQRLAVSRSQHLMTDAAPPVSVLIPARNEAGRVLSKSIRSILAQDYGRFAVIAVDDRSTDATASILRAIAETDDRLALIAGMDLPDGWLGKPHALQQALETSRGEWILITDADMIFEKEALRSAIDYAQACGLDALSLIPYCEALSFWERVFIPTWLWLLMVAFPVKRLNKAKSRQVMGFGGFFLLRRRTLEQIGAFDSVRAEAVEDIRLAELLRSRGAQYRIEYATHLLRTRMQSSFSEVWAWLTRTAFAGAKYSLSFAALGVLSGYACIIAPVLIAALCALMFAISGASVWLRRLLPASFVWLIQIFILALMNRKQGVPLAYALTTPLGFGLFYTALLASALKITFGSGITWRGRRIYERSGIRAPRGRIFESRSADD